jgi:hypothetical protein
MRQNVIVIVAVACALLAWLTRDSSRGFFPRASLAAETKDATSRESIARLEKETSDLRRLVPEQSVAMLAVAQQFANLWHAAQRKNWPLAGFFLEETEEGIEWAVRIQPTRQDTPAGNVNLAAIYDSVATSIVPELKAAIAAEDNDRFAQAYRHMIEGCFSCHKAVGKSFLRPQVPAQPATQVLNFDPRATWPQ